MGCSSSEIVGGHIGKDSSLEAGLYKENAELIQLAFCENNNYNLTVETDNGFWLDLGSGEIYCTRNIRPVKAAKYLKQEDSATGIFHVPVLCRYPGGLNPRGRWEAAEISAPDYSRVLEKAGTSIAEAVKTAKNDLKNTLSEPYAGVLLRFDEIQLADKRPTRRPVPRRVRCPPGARRRIPALRLCTAGISSRWRRALSAGK